MGYGGIVDFLPLMQAQEPREPQLCPTEMSFMLPPPFLIHVLRSPGSDQASQVAERIRDHFGTRLNHNFMGGPGIEVAFQGILDSDAPSPLQWSWQAGYPIAIIALITGSFAADAGWVTRLRDLGRRVAQQRFGALLLPVAMEAGVLNKVELEEQVLRWDQWDSANEAREQRLIRELAYEFARMLRGHLYMLRNPSGDQPGLERYLEKIQIFLSYTRKDGKEIAEEIRCWLHKNSALSTFLDVYDIPGGLPFSEVLIHNIRNSIFLAIHTDRYSSREWCRREVLEAKRKGAPMIVVDCLRDGDERAFPYLGNVPVIRMDPVKKNRLPEIAGKLLDEVLMWFLWRCRVKALPEHPTGTIFMSRPPELASLATLASTQEMGRTVVYPDPPIGKEETNLMSATWNGLRVRSMTEWLAKEGIRARCRNR